MNGDMLIGVYIGGILVCCYYEYAAKSRRRSQLAYERQSDLLQCLSQLNARMDAFTSKEVTK